MTCLFTSIYTHNIIISGVSQLRRTAFDSEVLTRISVYGEVGNFPCCHNMSTIHMGVQRFGPHLRELHITLFAQ